MQLRWIERLAPINPNDSSLCKMQRFLQYRRSHVVGAFGKSEWDAWQDVPTVKEGEW